MGITSGFGFSKTAIILFHVHVFIFMTNGLELNNLRAIIQQMYQRLDHNALMQEVVQQNNELKRKDPKYLHEDLPMGKQYSIALQLTHDECDNGRIETSIPTDFTQIRGAIAKRLVYNQGGVTAAIPLRIVRRNTEHAELRVLRSVNPDQNRCLIVYTHFSPCTTKCLDANNNNHNIYEPLSNVFSRIGNAKYKAFVYSTIFHRDIDTQTQTSMFNLLQRIKQVTIYCCYEQSGVVVCDELKSDLGPNQHCLSQLRPENSQ